ncbi:phage tail protein [Streptomyces sp. C36]|uniref:phage tail protein n=1 Tax=Streptomyces sp. C36 TaxID=3237122 RepID=UPI0034C684E4
MSLVQSLGRTTAPLRGFRTNADAAGRAAGNLGRQAGTANGNVGKLKGSSQQAAREVKTLRTNSDHAERSVGRLGKAAGSGSREMGKFEGGTKKAAGGVKGLNKSMRGNILGMLVELFAPLIEKVVTMASKSKTMQRIMKVAFDAISKAVDVAMKFIGPLIQITGKAISLVFKGLKLAIAPIVMWFSVDVPGAFKKVKEGLHAAWDSLPESAKAVFRTIYDAAKWPINEVIKLINRASDSVNGIHVKVPDWVPFIGGKNFTVNIGHIPLLAEGGVVQPRSGGVPAIVAEAGEAEAVMPLSKLDRLLSRTARDALGGGSARRGSTGEGLHIENYYATQTSDPQQTAMALMFLAKARG